MCKCSLHFYQIKHLKTQDPRIETFPTLCLLTPSYPRSPPFSFLFLLQIIVTAQSLNLGGNGVECNGDFCLKPMGQKRKQRVRESW